MAQTSRPPMLPLERLDRRDLPSNILGTAAATVAAPGSTAEVSVPVTAHNLGGRPSIYIGESITPAPGSTLEPRAVAVFGADGQKLQVRHGAAFVPGKHGSETLFVRVEAPGPVTTVVTGQHGTSGAFQLQGYLPGDVNGDGQVTPADLKPLTKSYATTARARLYNPNADANRNGQVGTKDIGLLYHNFTPVQPHARVFLNLSLSPREFAPPGHSQTSGGVTPFRNVIIYGKTVPNSIVLSDSSLGNYKFNGKAYVADAHGNFQVPVENTAGINNNDFKVVTPDGQHLIRDYPIFWTKFAAPGSPLLK